MPPPPCDPRPSAQIQEALTSYDLATVAFSRRGTDCSDRIRPDVDLKRTFADSFGSKEQRLADVLGVEIRIEREDLVGGLPFGDQPDDGCDRNP